MMKDNRDKVNWPVLLLILIYSIVIVFVLVLVSGCKTRYVPVPEYHEIHDTIKTIERRDSIVFVNKTVKDSTSFRQSGDTIRIEKWHWERDYRYEKTLQKKIDSLTQLKRDSVPYPVPGPIEYIEKPLKGWQKLLIWWGGICVALGIVIVFVKLKFPA